MKKDNAVVTFKKCYGWIAYESRATDTLFDGQFVVLKRHCTSRQQELNGTWLINERVVKNSEVVNEWPKSFDISNEENVFESKEDAFLFIASKIKKGGAA